MKVAEKMNKYIAKKGFKISVIAKNAGLNPELVSRALNGKRKLLADEFLALCEILDLSYDFFTDKAS